MALIDDFIKNEESKMYLAKKLGMGYLKVRSTPELTDTFDHLRLGNEKVIKPPLYDKAVIVILLFFAGCLWLNFSVELIDPSTRSFSNLSLWVIMILLIVPLVKSLSSDKKDFIITVDYDGIRIDDNKFYWTTIDEVYTMSKKAGKRVYSYLLIVKKDATMEKFDLIGFNISESKLSTIIEYYRTGQKE